MTVALCERMVVRCSGPNGVATSRPWRHSPAKGLDSPTPVCTGAKSDLVDRLGVSVRVAATFGNPAIGSAIGAEKHAEERPTGATSRNGVSCQQLRPENTPDSNEKSGGELGFWTRGSQNPKNDLNC
jgi:hypothetical protein